MIRKARTQFEGDVSLISSRMSNGDPIHSRMRSFFCLAASARSKTGIRLLATVFLLTLFCVPLHAQTVEDGIMVRKNDLFTGSIYTHDSWDEYWEGSRKRDNGNIGTLTTQTSTWSGNYGITNRLNFIVSVPYVWTNASQGVLHGQKGFQDITLAAKFAFLDRPFTRFGRLRAIAVLSGGIPLSNYTPDFQPLSIGLASKRIATRFTLYFESKPGWFLTGSSAYTWRDNVKLDRPYYFTENQLFLTNEVEMPNVFDYTVSAGYRKHGLMAPFTFTQQRVQGGGDIRRQDMPFVSNRMNFSRIGGFVMYQLPFSKLRGVAPLFSFSYILDGRNVGQSKTFGVGLMYTINFSGRPVQ